MIEIRLLSADDHNEVSEFWKKTPGIGFREHDDGAEGFKRFLNKNPESCFAAVSGGKIVGTILAGNDGRRGYLYHVAVDPAQRRQGIGTMLVNAAMDALAAADIYKTALFVYADNEEGNAFWEKQGFVSRSDLIYRNKLIQE